MHPAKAQKHATSPPIHRPSAGRSKGRRAGPALAIGPTARSGTHLGLCQLVSLLALAGPAALLLQGFGWLRPEARVRVHVRVREAAVWWIWKRGPSRAHSRAARVRRVGVVCGRLPHPSYPHLSRRLSGRPFSPPRPCPSPSRQQRSFFFFLYMTMQSDAFRYSLILLLLSGGGDFFGPASNTWSSDASQPPACLDWRRCPGMRA